MCDCPLVMCLTNTVAANFTANCLLAIGAKPAMVEEPSEAAELAAVADAILINVGTVHERQAEAMRRAAKVASVHGTPWVLDPVACPILTYRREIICELWGYHPSLVRGNLSEISFIRQILSSSSGPVPTFSGPVPTFSSGPVPKFPGSVPTLATGEVDEIVGEDGVQTTVPGGVGRLRDVTATGCAQGGVCAALLGRGQTPKEAALGASRLMKRAGEMAWAQAKEPGSFKVALVDALWRLTHD